MERRIEELYGDIRSRPTILAESAEQLQLEADARASKAPSSGGLGTAEALAGRLAPPPSRPAPPAARQGRGPIDGRRRIEALPVAADGIASASRPAGAPATGKGSAPVEGSLQAVSGHVGADQALAIQTAPRTSADVLQQPVRGGTRPLVGEKRRGAALETDRPAKQALQVSTAAPTQAQAASPRRAEIFPGSAPATLASSAVVPVPAQAGPLFADLGEVCSHALLLFDPEDPGVLVEGDILAMISASPANYRHCVLFQRFCAVHLSDLLGSLAV